MRTTYLVLAAAAASSWRGRRPLRSPAGATTVVAKISCLDQRLWVPGLELPVG